MSYSIRSGDNGEELIRLFGSLTVFSFLPQTSRPTSINWPCGRTPSATETNFSQFFRNTKIKQTQMHLSPPPFEAPNIGHIGRRTPYATLLQPTITFLSILNFSLSQEDIYLHFISHLLSRDTDGKKKSVQLFSQLLQLALFPSPTLLLLFFQLCNFRAGYC